MLNRNAKRWVKALRSGEYKQGIGTLRTPSGEFCCLGVACDLYAESHKRASWDHETFVIGEECDSTELPEKVMRWLGMKTRNGALPGNTLIFLNDVARRSFDEIADVIESNQDYLFES